jgi:hypothetical protein
MPSPSDVSQLTSLAYGNDSVPVFDEIAALAHRVEDFHITNTLQISVAIFERIPTSAVHVSLVFFNTTFTGEACSNYFVERFVVVCLYGSST